MIYTSLVLSITHDDIIKWKHFPRHWPFVRGIHWSPVNYPRKGQWRGALMFSLICTRIDCWVNNGEAGDLRRHRVHCDVTVMGFASVKSYPLSCLVLYQSSIFHYGSIDFIPPQYFLMHFNVVILITGCTRSWHFDNLWCSHYRKFHQGDTISIQLLWQYWFQSSLVFFTISFLLAFTRIFW